MTFSAEVDQLVQRVVDQVAQWPSSSQQAHGFGLLVGEAESVARQRRAQARTILASEALLCDLVASKVSPIILMKGLELAQLYPRLEQRPYNDVDVLVSDAVDQWRRCVNEGFRPDPNRRGGIDHHHLPALATPHGVGLELHVRANVPGWAPIPTELIRGTAQSSRTGIDGILRPRDDLHALLIALHCWKGGFTRLRDLLDASALALVSEVPVERTAYELGLGRFWRWTRRIADAELLGRSTAPARIASRMIVPRAPGHRSRTRSRVLAPYLVANPLAVTRAHLADLRLGREARGLRR